ncbi:hypothetical protein SH661x_003348 [Planctomicrobium sp. SH661]|uniref:bestrophin-like domain n=1 Tax=Planctomicrobium sp. SH661 TaxID=3448124 RepID=UPI003F5B17D1
MDDIPTWALAGLFSIAFIGFTWLGILLTRSRVRRWIQGQEDWNQVISYVVSCHGVLYGVMLALIAVAAYENCADARNASEHEAAALNAINRSFASYPDAVRTELQRELREYCRFVIEDEWPAQRVGMAHKGGAKRVSAIQTSLLNFQPNGPREEILHAATIDLFNQFVELRFERLQFATIGLPTEFWVVVVVGAILGVVLTWLFAIDRLSLHLTVSAVLSLLTGLVVFLIAAMDNPYRGMAGLSSESFEVVFHRLSESNSSPDSQDGE